MKKIAVFASGNGSNLQALINAIKEGFLQAEIAVLVCDRQGAFAIERAKATAIPTFVFSPKDYIDKKAYEAEILAHLKNSQIDFIILAGYMRLVGSTLLQAYENRIINIHPALLPSFPGLLVQQKAIDWGVRYSGATVHFVIPDVDMGPIISQAVVPVLQDDTEETLSARILKEEHRIYPEAVKLFFEGRLEVRNNRVFILD